MKTPVQVRPIPEPKSRMGGCLWLLIVLITFFALSAKGQVTGSSAVDAALLDQPIHAETMEYPLRIVDCDLKTIFQLEGFPKIINEFNIYTVRFEDRDGISTMIYMDHTDKDYEIDHGFFVDPVPAVRNSRTTEYDSSQYVRIAEFQELKQKLNDQKEAYRRELMGLVLARFCTFMSPEKAAIEAVRYSDALLKELEK